MISNTIINMFFVLSPDDDICGCSNAGSIYICSSENIIRVQDFDKLYGTIVNGFL
jgi:hypothetical protein